MGSGKSTIARLLAGLYELDVDHFMMELIFVRLTLLIYAETSALSSRDMALSSVKENIQMGFVQYSDEHILEISKLLV